MTTIGHILTGTAIYIAGRPRTDKNNTTPTAGRVLFAACLFCAAVPDLDLFAGFLTGSYLHRGLTHSILFCLLLGLGVGALIVKKVKKFPSLSRRRVYLLCLVCALSHLVIDFFGADTYAPMGIPLFWPFTNRYFISPVALFPTSMRGSFDFVFSVHNFITAIIELIFGGLLCLASFVLVGQRTGTKL